MAGTTAVMEAVGEEGEVEEAVAEDDMTEEAEVEKVKEVE
jgi:hypothetical protein